MGNVRDVKLMSAFIGSGVTAELIHLPCQLMCEDGVVGKPVVITCAVTNKLREKMLLKPSDLKKLRDGEGVFGRSSPYSEGYTFEHSWFDMAQIPDEEGVVKKEQKGEVRVREVDVPPDEGDDEQGSDQESVEAEEEGD